MKVKESTRRILLSALAFVLLISVIFVGTSSATKANTNNQPTYGQIDNEAAINGTGDTNASLSKTVKYVYDEKGNKIEGYYDITFVAKGSKESITSKEKLNVVFLLDHSGSMYYTEGRDHKGYKHKWLREVSKRDKLVNSEKAIKEISTKLVESFADSGLSMQLMLFATSTQTGTWRDNSPLIDDDFKANSESLAGSATNIQSALQQAQAALANKEGENIVFILSDGVPTKYKGYDLKDGEWDKNSNFELRGPGGSMDDATKKATLEASTALKEEATVFSVGMEESNDILKQIASQKSEDENDKYYYYYQKSTTMLDDIAAIVKDFEAAWGTDKATITDTLPEYLIFDKFITGTGQGSTTSNVVTFQNVPLGTEEVTRTVRVKLDKTKLPETNGTVDGWHKTNVVAGEGVRMDFKYSTATETDVDGKIVINESANIYAYDEYGYEVHYYKGTVAPENRLKDSGNNAIIKTSEEKYRLDNVDVLIDKTEFNKYIDDTVTENGVVYENPKPEKESYTLGRGQNIINVIYTRQLADVDYSIEYYVDSILEHTILSSELSEMYSDYKPNVKEGTTVDVAQFIDLYKNGFPGDVKNYVVYIDDANNTNITNLNVDTVKNTFKIYYATKANAGEASVRVSYYEKTVNGTDEKVPITNGDKPLSTTYTVNHGDTVTLESLQENVTKGLDNTKHISANTKVYVDGNPVNADFTINVVDGESYTVEIVHEYQPTEATIVARFSGGTRDGNSNTIITRPGFVGHLALKATNDSEFIAKDAGYVTEGYKRVSITPESVMPTLENYDNLEANTIIVDYVYNVTSYNVEFYFDGVQDESLKLTDVASIEIGSTPTYSRADALTVLDTTGKANIYKIADGTKEQISLDHEAVENKVENNIKVYFVSYKLDLVVEHVYYNENGEKVNVAENDTFENLTAGTLVSFGDETYVNRAKADQEKFKFSHVEYKGNADVNSIMLVKNEDRTITVVYTPVEQKVDPVSVKIMYWLDEAGVEDNFLGEYETVAKYADGSIFKISEEEKNMYITDAITHIKSISNEELTVVANDPDANVIHVVYAKQAPSIDEPKDEEKPKTTILGLPAIATGDVNNAIAYLTLLLLAAGAVVGTYKVRKNRKNEA